MKEALARVPVPICGVALGVMGLANICTYGTSGPWDPRLGTTSG